MLYLVTLGQNALVLKRDPLSDEIGAFCQSL